jgi:peptidoglycan hydrolase-like protein with peptidoglycan-binding domain
VPETVHLDGSGLNTPETDPPIPWGGFGLSSPPLSSPAVRELQRKLARRGFTVEADGVYGEETAAAVAALKARLRLTADPQADRASPELLSELGL